MRFTCNAVVVLVLMALVAGTLNGARAEEGRVDPDPRGIVASDAEAAEALALFKRQFRARGLSPDEKLSQRDYAMRILIQTQHPDVVNELGKIARKRDASVSTLAIIYLGDMSALPGPAGRKVLDAMKKHKRDRVRLVASLKSLGQLKYLGARDRLRTCLAHDDYAIKKAAIAAIGETGDYRMMDFLLKLVGVVDKAGKDGGDDPSGTQDATGTDDDEPIVVEEGYSWDGVDTFIAYSGSGDELAERERKGQALIDQNRRAAEQRHREAQRVKQATGGSSAGRGAGGSSTGMTGHRNASSRDGTDLLPLAVQALRKMTGEGFNRPLDVVVWLMNNRALVAERCRALDAEERTQKRDRGAR